MHDSPGSRQLPGPLMVLGAAAAVAGISYAVVSHYRQAPPPGTRRDDAPLYAAKSQPGAGFTVGRTITVNKPRDELFAFWSDFSNLSRFMHSVRKVTVDGEIARWEVDAPLNRTVQMETRVTTRTPNETLVWETTEASEMQARGKVTFRDAPAERGTELEAEIAYTPPLGDLGRLIGTLFQTDPLLQGRRELRRFKMLMETGEIATSRNHHTTAKEHS